MIEWWREFVLSFETVPIGFWLFLIWLNTLFKD